MATAAAPTNKSRKRRLTPVPQKECEVCGANVSGRDKHSMCLYCLGIEHAEAALSAPGSCRACSQTEKKFLVRRLNRIRDILKRELAANNDEEEFPPIKGPDTAVAAPTDDGGEWGVDEAPNYELEIEVPNYELDPIYDTEPPYNILDEDSEDVYFDDPDEGEAEAYGDEDSHVLPANSEPQVAAAPADGTGNGDAGGNAPTAAVAAEEEDPGAKLTVDMSDIQEIFKRAAARCKRPWPIEQETQPSRDCDIFEHLGPAPAKQPARGILPVVNGFYETLQGTWNHPRSSTLPDARKLDCVDMAKNGLDGLPPVDEAMALHLLKRKPLLSNEPTFDLPTDREFSEINKKSYNTLASTAKTVGAALLLQGSMAAMYKKVGDAPSPQDMAEFRRLHNELLDFSKSILKYTGRAMAYSVVMERARWLERSELTADQRKTILDQAVNHEGLFKKTMTMATERCSAEHKASREALNSAIPVRGGYASGRRVSYFPQAAGRARYRLTSPPGRTAAPPGNQSAPPRYDRAPKRDDQRGGRPPATAPTRGGRGGYRGNNKKRGGT